MVCNLLPPPSKFTELREKDFQHYEMEKRFVEEQRLRHIKDEERRKAEQDHKRQLDRARNGDSKERSRLELNLKTKYFAKVLPYLLLLPQG